MSAENSASKQISSYLPTNKNIISPNLSASAQSLNTVNPNVIESVPTSISESSSASIASTTKSPSSVDLSSAESIQPPKSRTLSIDSLPPGISVSSIKQDAMKTNSVSEPKSQSNYLPSGMENLVEKPTKEEGNITKTSIDSVNLSTEESIRPQKPKILSINNLPPGISVSSVPCDSARINNALEQKIQTDDILSAMDKFVDESVKEEGKLNEMREDLKKEEILEQGNNLIGKADISILASQVLNDPNHKLKMIGNISISLVSESNTTNKNLTKRKRNADTNDLSFNRDEDNIETDNGKRKRNEDCDDLPKIKDGGKDEDAKIELSSC